MYGYENEAKCRFLNYDWSKKNSERSFVQWLVPFRPPGNFYVICIQIALGGFQSDFECDDTIIRTSFIKKILEKSYSQLARGSKDRDHFKIQMHSLFNRNNFHLACQLKVVFFQEVWFVFQISQFQKEKCSKFVSWAWNSNFPPKRINNKFKLALDPFKKRITLSE